MTGSSMSGSMFEDPALQELVAAARNRFGKAGLVVLAELCRRELHESSFLEQPSLVAH